MRPILNLLFHLHHETEAERPTRQAYEEVLSLIRQADTLPIGCAWLAEHHLLDTRGRLPAPLLMAVAGARETRRLQLGPCVLLMPLHSPLDLAEQIATADLLTRGRLLVGLGSGGNPEEFAAFGVSLDERAGRFAEGVEVLSRALTGKPFSFSGTYYQVPEVTLMPRPLQPPAHMLWVATGSVASARLAGQSGAHLLLARGMSLARLREQIAAYEEARAAQGLQRTGARVQVTRGLYVAPTDAQAWEEAAYGVVEYLRRSGRSVETGSVRELAQQGDFIIGSPETCAAAISELAAAVPITDLACDIALVGMPHTLRARCLDLLGNAVAPLLAHGQP
jgi:alkanesulfonate monooxygenase SsuD/methylene tetrahydromethanopterin reductase-like flavin-dependent oxidoreductase (luciferase family)